METSMRSYRKELVRNFFVFQFKLLLDGIKDVLLFNFSIIIVIIDLVQGWCPRTVTRQAPIALVVQTMVKAWPMRHGVKAKSAQPKEHEVCGWLDPKTHPSYLDMLATLRIALWRDRINLKSIVRVAVRKTLDALQFTLSAAA